MKTPIAHHRSLNTIFCDDIRMEVGNKTTLVGIYNSVMIIENDLPYVLPKLCVSATVKAPKGMEFKELDFKLFKDNEEITGNKITAEDLEKQRLAYENDPDSQVCIFTVYLTVQPFVIDKSCEMKLVVETESELLNDVHLKIITRNQD